MFGLQNVQPTSRNSAAHLSTKQDDFTSIFSKALIFKEILCRSVAKTEKWTTLVHFSDDFVSFDNGGDGFVGEFVVPFTPIAGSTLTAAAGAWLQGRAGRRLRLTMGNTEVEATSPGELYGLLNLTMAVSERLAKPETDHV